MTFHDRNAIRPAAPADAPVLARLIDIAGEGIPNWLWSQSAAPGETALQVGEARARRETGGFSYRNAVVAEFKGEPVGMMLGYMIEPPTEDDLAAVAGLPEPIRPFVELEHESVGTFYVNALAVLPGRRGLGIGSRLMHAAEEAAAERGAEGLSIQVYSQNAGAVGLYERLGYRTVARRPVLLHPCQPYYDEDVLLMMKDVTGAG